jgi:uncharacterized protein (DUF1810 family)
MRDEPATEAHALDRFVRAQEPVVAAVRRELAAGRKATHWMWFVFPQLRGLGHSETARHYGIASLAEARAYLDHPVLGPRLVECVSLILAVEGRSARQIFGSPDDLKFRSSMTLFSMARPEQTIFAAAIARYFDLIPDPLTQSLLREG